MRKIGLFPLALLLVMLYFISSYLSMLAPFSGTLWIFEGKKDIKNPYGKVEVYYDEFGVPHFYASDEKALAFAVGYIQAKDRLFQMDLHRRLMKGELSEVFGEDFYESDVFYKKMDFLKASEITWESLKDTYIEELLKAYSEGVNYYIETEKLPLEFQLANYKPEKWQPVDTLLISKEIGWGLTGDFWDIRRAIIIEKLGEKALELYPSSFKHNYTILRINKSFADWLENFEPEKGMGSNNWVVSGNFTENGKPMLANDPHLLLTVPPVWYEMHLNINGQNVRGVTIPGIGMIIIGKNDYLAWGFTNVGADVIDFYYYVWNGSKYLYKGLWLEPEKEIKKIRVKTANGFEEREVVVEKTVHGALIEKDGFKVAVAWTGFTNTTEAFALYKYNYARNISEFIEGLKLFCVPGQNVVYADIYGNTMYYPAGKYPIRLINGKEVSGNVIFNGSAGDGEWVGFKAFGFSSWEGFIPFEEIPHAINPDYIATANQEIGYEKHYLGDSMYFIDPYRGMRIYEMLDELTAKKKLTVEDFINMQRDTKSKVAEFFVPFIIETMSIMDEKTRSYAEKLRNWDLRMEKDSEGALIFAIWLEKFVNETFDEFFSAGLDQEYLPSLFVIQNLPPESEWFDDKRTPEIEKRQDIAFRALKLAIEEIEKNGYRAYGDYNQLKMEHPFSRVVKFFDYPKVAMSGDANTVFNFHRSIEFGGAIYQAGSSWRMIVSFDEDYCVIPGGNSGNFFSKNYDDQLILWAEGRYKSFDFKFGGDKIVFG
ncbi:MAG: penicillin acylase family protein [Archaeoglobaceae archaeon]|nr:penicillin acylase family protein [Archaeoglobaceae archaeon]MDW8118147.1 penicillin acylase family protein [Archaeoglobaceae archaeon]